MARPHLFFVASCALAACAKPPPPQFASLGVTSAEVISPNVAVSPQFASTHVYVAEADVNTFARSFLETFGGQSTTPAVLTVTPTPSSATSQILMTPVGLVSLFAYSTPIPYPFGSERTGYLVSNMDMAMSEARGSGAEVVVQPFEDATGRDAIVRWAGGVDMQLYWHAVQPSYPALQTVPENRVYLSRDRVDAFVHDFVAFSRGMIVSDDPHAPGSDVGHPNDSVRRVEIASAFGKVVAFATDGHMPYPYGRETTGYEVKDLTITLAKAGAAGATVLVQPYSVGARRAAMVQFPGGYVAEIHAPAN